MNDGLFKKMHVLYAESKKLGLSRIDVDVLMIVAKNITEKTGQKFSDVKWDKYASSYFEKEDYKKIYNDVVESFYIEPRKEEESRIKTEYHEKELALLGDYLSKCVKNR